MRVVMSSIPDWSGNFLIFHITYDSLLSDYKGMAKWFRAQYNQEVRFSSAVKCKKGPRSGLRCLIKDKIIIIIVLNFKKYI